MRKNLFIAFSSLLVCIALAVGVGFAVLYDFGGDGGDDNSIHIHDYGDWITDGDYHWLECKNEGCDEPLKSYAEHADLNGDGNCDDCGLNGVEHVHNYVSAITEPTCTEQGFTTYTCPCGESRTDDFTEAAGHYYSGGKCRICGVEHDCKYVSTVKQANCTERGFTTYVCSCGRGYTDEFVAALGHDFSDGKCMRCGMERVAVEKVSLDKSYVTFALGSSEVLTATITPEDAFDKGVIWTSSDESIVTVKDGGITAVGYGVATVTVTTVDGNKTATCEVSSGEFRFMEIYSDDEIVGYSVLEINSLVGSEVVIPERYRGKPVTALGYSAFSGCKKLEKVTIPDSVTKIGNSAFSGCGSLKSVYLGKGLSSVGVLAFKNCGRLEEIAVSKENPYYSGEGNCLIDVREKRLILGSKNSVIPEGVTQIGGYSFGGSYVKAVSLPYGVTTISDYAFSESRISSITFPVTLQSIGNYAFYNCTGLVDMNFCGTTEEWQSLEKGEQWFSMITVVHCADGDYNPTSDSEFKFSLSDDGTYYVCDGINGKTDANLFIPSYYKGKPVKEISSYAFLECTASTVSIPSTVTTIGLYAFGNCNNLTSVYISDGVKNIGNYAFYGCNNLSKIWLPSTVTALEGYTFTNCTALKEIIFDGTAEEWIAIPHTDWLYITSCNIVCTDFTIHHAGIIMHENKADGKRRPLRIIF